MALVIAVILTISLREIWKPHATVRIVKEGCNVATSSKVALLSSLETSRRGERLWRGKVVLRFSSRNAGQATVPKQLAKGLFQATIFCSTQQCAVRYCHRFRKLSEHLFPVSAIARLIHIYTSTC
jgi:hypothetical protein